MASPSAAPTGTAARRVGFLTHERYYWHNSGIESHSPWAEPRLSNESAASKRRFQSLVDVSALRDVLVHLTPRPATDAELLRFHTRDYVDKVKAVSAQTEGGLFGHELHIGAGGFEIAALSAGGVLACVDEVMAGRLDSAYALVRPPGHHAERDTGMGFCVFSNVSLAADHALAVHGLERVAVVDFDVHHGNGTQQHFWARRDCLFISLHQELLYPLAGGQVEEAGEGAGRGYTLNVPLPPGSGWGCYADALQRVVLPALDAYRPQLILVSAGFDAAFLDPLGRMLLTSEHFGMMTAALRAAADRLCGGKIVFAHEGGYSESYVPFCGVAVLEVLTGAASGVVDPFLADVGSPAWQALQPHQAAAVARAAANLQLALC